MHSLKCTYRKKHVLFPEFHLKQFDLKGISVLVTYLPLLSNVCLSQFVLEIHNNNDLQEQMTKDMMSQVFKVTRIQYFKGTVHPKSKILFFSLSYLWYYFSH